MTLSKSGAVSCRMEGKRGAQTAFNLQHKDPWHKRLICSLAIIGSVLLAVSVSGLAAQGHTPGVIEEAVGEAGREVAGSLSLVEALTATGGVSATLPESFETEVMNLSEYQDIRASEGGSVVGFSSDKTGEETFVELSGKLVQNGWSKVESGVDIASTFVKETGDFRWVYLSCTEVSDQTSVVLQFLERS